MENQNDQNQNHTPPVSPVGQTPPIQTPPVSKQKSKLPVGIIIGIILFLIVAGSTAGFYVFKQQSLKTALKPVPSVIPDVTRNPPSPSPDPTANWKTYTDKELGFSIKYPTTILKDRREICTNDASGLGLHDLRYKKEWEENPNQFCVVASPELTIDVFSNKPQEKSDEYWTVVEETILLDGISVEKLTSTRTDKIYEGTSSPYKKTVQYEINKGNRQFSIFYGTPSNISEDLFNQILSTFKFTNSQTVDTSNWKIYKSSNGYSIKYPSEWITGKNGQGCAAGDYFHPQSAETKGYMDAQKACPTSDSVVISVNKNTERLTTEEFAKKGNSLGKTTAITINGITAIELTDSPGSVPRTYVYIPNKDSIYSVTLNGGNNIISQETFSQMLSTFKFTN